MFFKQAPSQRGLFSSPPRESTHPPCRLTLRGLPCSSRHPEVPMTDRYQTILLFGAPGSGKGTQGKILGQIPGFYHLSCGEVFRTLDTGSDLGKVFMEYSSRGELVPDDVTVKMWH